MRYYLLQDVVFALAHATGKVGRFTLIEKWRNNERLLAPNENPLKVFSEYTCVIHIYTYVVVVGLGGSLGL